MELLGFNVKWISWIRACVFSGKLSVLVNECPTQEINIQKGLKQGDPLAPFLFLLVAKSLSASIRKAEESREFIGFQVGSLGLKCYIYSMLMTPCSFGNLL
jgi:hypothetical protein